MTSIETFLGADTVARPSSGHVWSRGLPVRSINPDYTRPSSGFVMATGKALYEATLFTDATITHNPNSTEVSGILREFLEVLRVAKSANDPIPAGKEFIRILTGTRDLMKNALKGGLMSDKITQRIADRIHAGNLLFLELPKVFPSGIAIADAATAERLIDEINSLIPLIQAKRNTDYQMVVRNKITALKSKAALADMNSQVPGGGSVTSPDVPGSTGPDSVPGGGGYSTSDEVPVEKTAAQKYGPVLALLAGGIAAYYAFK